MVKEKNDWIHKRLEGLNASESTEFWTKYKYVFGAPKDNLIGNLRNGGDLISEEAEKEALLFDTFFTGRHLNNLDFDEEHYTKINTELPQKLLAEMENEVLNFTTLLYQHKFEQVDGNEMYPLWGVQ